MVLSPEDSSRPPRPILLGELALNATFGWWWADPFAALVMTPFIATALRLVGASLLALAVYVVYDSATALVYREPPQASPAGIALAIVSLIVMPLLAWQKRRVAAAINSQAMAADSVQTSICTYLSAILLGGLLLNALWGWWWADPLAALAMTPFITREGMEALRAERCGGCTACGTPACTCVS